MEETGPIRVVKVWDWETRVLHWVNAILVIALILLAIGYEGLEELGVGKAAREQLMLVHVYIGYILIVTFSMRLLWGFFGNKYARWSDISPLGREKLKYISDKIKWYFGGFRGTLPMYPGHDPLGALFYIAVFIILFLMALTGILLAGIEMNLAPWHGFFSGYGHGALEMIEEASEEVHEFGFYFILIFLFAHLGAIIIHEVKEKTGLLSSMVHGCKYLRDEK